jgi:spore coat polysaccharide biosynthesis protein SpsF
MRIGYIILCRFGSSRLPGKILRRINNKPLLQYIFERLLCVAPKKDIIVATGSDETNRPIAEFCKDNQIQYFLGDPENVALRFLTCAKEYQLDYAARINGDNLFVSPAIIKAMLPHVRSGQYDLISNVKKRTFPTGMSVEFLRSGFYEEIIKLFDDPRHFEHVTLYLYEHETNGKRYYFYNTLCPEAKGHHLAIDTEQDFRSAEKLLVQIEKDHTAYDICDWIRLTGPTT